MMMRNPVRGPRPAMGRCGMTDQDSGARGVLTAADMPGALPGTMAAPLPPAGRACVTGSGGGCTRSVRQSRDLPPVC